MNPKPVLDAATIYCTPDRFICGQVQCAGTTALYTGRTSGGAPVLPVTAAEVALWSTEGMRPLACQCGALSAVLDGDGALHFQRRATRPAGLLDFLPEGMDDAQRRALERGAAQIQERILDDLDREYEAHGDVLTALAVVMSREVTALAACGRGLAVQEACRDVVAYIAAPMVAAALLAGEIPDTIAGL